MSNFKELSENTFKINEEELMDYMRSLNKNIGTETEMKVYEIETLVDNNLESTEKTNIEDENDNTLETVSFISQPASKTVKSKK